MINKADDFPPRDEAEQQDALRSITDVGPKYAEALHQIGVHQPADLVHFTPEKLAEVLRTKAGVKVTPDRIRAKDWIGQARKLGEIQAAISEPEHSPDPVEETGLQKEGGLQMEAGAYPQEAGASEWRERGMFTIKFLEQEDPKGKQAWQITVYHEGGPGPEKPFEGLDPSPWVNWIFARMRLPVETPVELKIAEEQPAAAPGLAHASLPRAQQPAPDEVEFTFEEVDVNPWPEAPKKRLEVVARFRLLGENARRLAGIRAPFQIEFYLINLETNDSINIGSRPRQMEPEQDTYVVRQDFAIPRPGRYELQTILLLPSQGNAAFRSGPIFKVVK